MSVDVTLGKNFYIKDYKVNGSVKKVNVKVLDNLLIKLLRFSFYIR